MGSPPRSKATSETIREIIAELERFYDKKLNSSRKDFYALELSKLDEDDLCRAVIRLRTKETLFPTVATIQRYVWDEREARLEKEKATAPDFSFLKTNAEKTEHGRKSIALMQDLYEGRKTRAEYVAAMYQMDKDYPGIGWKENADELKAFWDSEPQRHEKGQRYLERIWAEVDARKEDTRTKLKSQAQWLRERGV